MRCATTTYLIKCLNHPVMQPSQPVVTTTYSVTYLAHPVTTSIHPFTNFSHSVAPNRHPVATRICSYRNKLKFLYKNKKQAEMLFSTCFYVRLFFYHRKRNSATIHIDIIDPNLYDISDRYDVHRVFHIVMG